MSTHAIEVVPVKLEEHPNADTLSIVRIKGWRVVVKTEEWADRDRGAYIPPDYVVPDNDRFAFLGGHLRVKTRKFRNIYSQGLLMPVDPETPIGTDLMEEWGIVRYVPPVDSTTGGDNEKGPDFGGGYFPVFDVENYQAHPDVFQPGERVIATEKIHGANARYCWQDRMFCGSRKNWKQEDDRSIWWLALRQHPPIETFCKANPGLALYGEVFGKVQHLRYGSNGGQFFFVAFNVWDVMTGSFLDYDDMVEIVQKTAPDLNLAPLVYDGPFDAEKLLALAEEDSLWPGAKHMREGIVVIPAKERMEDEIGRVALKMVSNRYLAKAT